MREGWEIKKIGEVCDVQGGSTPKRTESSFWEGGTYPWFTVEDIREQGHIITDTKQKVTKVAWDKLRVFPKDTILLCCTASLGEYAITHIPLTSNQQFNGLIIRDKSYLNPMYLMYYCSTLKDKLTKLSGRATIDFVSAEKVRQIPIPVPPIIEQHRIVDILDAEFAKIDALKENTEKNLQNAKDLFQAVLRKELEPKEGWRQTSIGKVCVLKSGNSNANNSPVGSLPFVKVGDMNIKGNEEKITCSSNYVSYGENRKNIFPIGTIIFPKRGGAILTNKKRITAVEICCDLNIMGVYSLGEILPEYLYFHFLTVDLSKIYNGAAIPQINNGDISPLCISYPIEKKEQQKIIDKLILHKSNSMALHLNYEKTIALCNDMKQALLRKAFNGEM